MVQSNRVRTVAMLLLFALTSCDGCGDDESCTVKQLDAGMSISCGDGTEATIPPPCSVEEVEEGIVVSCSDGTEVTIPSGDAGAGSCNVRENEDGTITISCPDGSSVTVPAPAQDAGAAQDGGLDASTLPLIIYTGATATACGGCHDDEANKTHFASMTALVNGKPVEDCVTCHQAGGLRPVSQVHARLEFGPPGFNVQILEAGIDPATRKLTVNLRVQDGDGGPLNLTGVSSTFLIASVPPETPVGGITPVAGPYVNYFTRPTTQVDNPDFPLEGTPRVVQQPFGESNGTFADAGSPGLFSYTFAGALPADYDGGVTHVVSQYSTRTVAGVRWVSNSAHFFVPADPAATPLRRRAVHTESCNSCHNPLSFHGGSRQELDVCLSCHSQGSSDPESSNSIDLNVMIHRIHMGKELPSVKAGGSYKIVGRSNTTEDFSHVGYPRDIVHCQSCHTDADDDRWYSNGKPAVCMSCHDTIHDPGVHPFALAPAAVCGNSNCHGPGGSAPDARAAHKTFLNSDAPIFDISILSATVANPDSAPALTVRALTGTRLSGATVPVTSADRFSTLNVFLNGPNADYASNGHNIKYYQKAALVGLSASNTPGEFTFALPETLRVAVGANADPAKDSFTLGIRAAYDPTPNAAPDNDRVDMQKNPTIAIAAAGTAVPRVAVVDTAKCNSCHGVLSWHNGSAFMARNTDQCVMCHTATIETSGPQGGNREPGPTKSLRFSKLIHRIHAGGMATEPYVLYDYAPMPPYPTLDFTDIGFPGDRKDCVSCHISASDPTYDIPLQASTAPTQTLILDGTGKPITQ
jgi:OmcA/MtrC family decaheme c-type cytochrome